MKKIILTLLAVLAVAASSFAQAPAGFKYQAVLRDASNTVLTNQAVGVRLTIQQGAIGGTAVYTETFAPTTNAYGLVNLEIGSGTTVDDFSAIDWAAGPYFIETAVDVAGGTTYVVMGTSQLLSVPYALHATTADSALNDANTQLTEAEVDAFADNNGYLTTFVELDGDPTNEFNTGAVLNGTSLEITDGGGTISTDLSSLGGGGGGNWTLTGADISNNNTGNVGIGIANPLQLFAIMNDSASMTIGNSAFNSPNSGRLTFSEDVDNTGGECGFQFTHDGAANIFRLVSGCFIPSAGDTLLQFYRAGGTATKRLRIGDLGQPSAATPLSVAGNSDFVGNMTITGNLTVSGTIAKGGGTFKIDHPQDPENKYLVHSFVESPEMMNVYSGNITTDASGFAVVELPAYFEAANKDFRYQLTVMGTFAQAIVKEKIVNNTFVIQTNESNVEVSWQVTGVRSDKFANANRVVVEQEKEVKGTYLHPELYNANPAMQEAKYRRAQEAAALEAINAAADQ